MPGAAQGPFEPRAAALKALEADLRVKYEEPSKAEAELSALSFDNQAEMQLIRMQRIHEQSYHQATTALMKHRKQTAAMRRPAAEQPLDQSMLIPPRRVRAPRVSDPAPGALDRDGVAQTNRPRGDPGSHAVRVLRCIDPRLRPPRWIAWRPSPPGLSGRPRSWRVPVLNGPK